jgi:Major tropism determinant N-terminal domain
MSVLIQLRRDTAANWTSVNPVLNEGELGVETDTSKSKMGDGVTAWTSLSYWNTGAADALGAAAAAQAAAESYAASEASAAQSAAETYATSAAGTAQANAETYAASQASTAQTAAETYAAAQASSAQTAAETYASGLVTTEAGRAETAEGLKASLASPSFTGTPTAPTPAGSDNSTKIATTAYVTTAISAAGDGYPSILTDNTGGLWLMVVSASGTLTSLPLLQDQLNNPILDQSGAMLI